MASSSRRLSWTRTAAAALLLVATTGVFVSANYFGQRRAIREIERLGGKVVTTHGGPRWLIRLAGGRSLRVFDKATVVNLARLELRDADLRLLHRLKGVERLHLGDTPIGDEGLEHLRGLDRLKALDLSRTRITGDGLRSLGDLVGLEYLYLGGTDVGDEHLKHLARLANLKVLSVEHTEVTPEGLAERQRSLPDRE